MQLQGLVCFCLLASIAIGEATSSPIDKVLQLISDLQAKVIKEGEEAHKVFAEYSEWCEDRSRNVDYEIKTGKAQVEELKASIAKEVATSEALTSKIEELVAGISTDEADLKAATEIRTKEGADFSTEEKELMEIVSTLERSVAVLEREMSKHGASMLQLRNAKSLAQALSALVEATAISSADASRLTAFVQNSQSAASDDEDMQAELGARAAAIYEGHNGDIIETLQGLLDKAEAQLNDLRTKETSARHNFELLQQSLHDELKFANKDMAEAKKSLAASAEAKSTAEGDLTMTAKELATDQDTKSGLHSSCMGRAEDFEAEVKSRTEELNALAEAKKVLSDTTSGAVDMTYSMAQQASFFQASADSTIASGTDLANFEAVRFVRDLARKQGSSVLAQLAQRMAAAVRLGSEGGADPFAKVKGLLTDMIAKLAKEAEAEATEKAYCDKELAETAEKKSEKSYEIEKLNTKIDQMSVKSAQLKEEVAALNNALAKLAASQAEMDQIRQQEHADFVSNEADMKQGLQGVKTALKVLREYYSSADSAAHSAASGAGTGIIGLLEVVESDFTKSLASAIATEDMAEAAYQQQTQLNKIEKSSKDKDVEYKTKEFNTLDKDVAELTSDRMGVQAELDAVLEYLSKLQARCTAKAETYSERKARREAEITGLKEALQILESETALVQQKARRQRTLRGSSSPRQAKLAV